MAYRDDPPKVADSYWYHETGLDKIRENAIRVLGVATNINGFAYIILFNTPDEPNEIKWMYATTFEMNWAPIKGENSAECPYGEVEAKEDDKDSTGDANNDEPE